MLEAKKVLDSYRQFLQGIPLEKYRETLKDIKWVEQDRSINITIGNIIAAILRPNQAAGKGRE